MARLSIFNKFGERLETHSLTESFRAWMLANVPTYKAATRHPFSTTLNGEPWPSNDHDRGLTSFDDIALTIEPQDPWTITAIVFSTLAVGYSLYVASQIPSGYQDSTPDGNSIYSANVKVNRAKPNGIIREVAGDVPLYPDLICPVHRYYVGHQEFTLLNLCVGVGHFDLFVANLFIAETAFSSYAGDMQATISGPGADISGHPAHENWYLCKEVADLKLSTEVSETTVGGNWTIDTASNTITAYLDGNAAPFPHGVGERFTIDDGANSGTYRVDAITNDVATVVKQEILYESEPGSGVIGPFYLDLPTDLAVETGVSVSWASITSSTITEGPYAVIPEYETTTAIEVDVNFPFGLIRYKDGKYPRDRSVEIKIEWREIGTSTWNTVPNTTFTDQVRDERGYTITIDLGSAIRPEIRFTRVTPDNDDVEISDEVRIKRVKAKLPTKTAYDDVTTLQLTIRSTNAVAQSAENKINVRGAVRKLPTLANLKAHIQEGEPLIYEPTQSIMRFSAWSLWDSHQEDAVDWGMLGALDSELGERGDTLNCEFADKTTLWEAQKLMLIPGYCEPSAKEGRFRPVRFAATDDYLNLYTPDVMLGQDGFTRTDTHYKTSEPKGIIVEYLDPVSGSNETINCFLDGDSELYARRIQLKGVTDRTRAYRLGMRERLRLRYKPATYTWSTATDALNSDYGDPDALVNPLNANQSFFVLTQDDDVLTLDDVPEYMLGETYYAVLRKDTGQFSGVYTIAPGDAENQIRLITPDRLDFAIVTDAQQCSTICCIGTLDQLVERVIIREINPSGTQKVNVTAEEYIPEIYQYDNSELSE